MDFVVVKIPKDIYEKLKKKYKMEKVGKYEEVIKLLERKKSRERLLTLLEKLKRRRRRKKERLSEKIDEVLYLGSGR